MQMLVNLNVIDTNDLKHMKYSDKCSILIDKEGVLLKKAKDE
jgi:hypothetical protein